MTVIKDTADLGQDSQTQSSSKRVLLAAPRGYCAGVDRAVIAVEKALDHYGSPVYVRKQIVHNKHVVDRLKAMGHTVVISTHQKRMIAVTDYMLVLNQGRMASFGPTAKVLEAFRASSNAAAAVTAEPVGEAAV